MKILVWGNRLVLVALIFVCGCTQVQLHNQAVSLKTFKELTLQAFNLTAQSFSSENDNTTQIVNELALLNGEVEGVINGPDLEPVSK